MIAEVAGKYAAAREALTGAEQAHAEASAVLQAAQHAEREAWEALEALAGRKPPEAAPVATGLFFAEQMFKQQQARGQMLRQGGADVIPGKIA
jgi:predicted component of type VI protein secretion system